MENVSLEKGDGMLKSTEASKYYPGFGNSFEEAGGWDFYITSGTFDIDQKVIDELRNNEGLTVEERERLHAAMWRRAGFAMVKEGGELGVRQSTVEWVEAYRDQLAEEGVVFDPYAADYK